MSVGINFLTELFDAGKSYSTINSARSALSQFVSITDEHGSQDFGKHPLTVKFMRGVFKLRPTVSRHSETWDVRLVTAYLGSIDSFSCSLKDLSLKCATLLAIASGQRVQTLAAVEVGGVVPAADGGVICKVDSVLKTSRPGFQQRHIHLCRYSADTSICPASCLAAYLEKTKLLRGDHSALFVSFVGPHKPVSAATLGRWISTTLRLAGVPSCFSAHSTRAASTSKAAGRIPIDAVLSAAGWTNEQTFARFYNRPISTLSFSEAVLS